MKAAARTTNGRPNPLGHPSFRPVTVLGGLGVALTLAGSGLDLTDAAPRAQLWVGAAAGAAFLLAVPLAEGAEDQTLVTRARLLIGAGVASVLAVFGLWQATERAEPRVLLLLVPALLLFVTAGIGIREASRSRTAVHLGQLRARLDGQETERRRWALELHDQTLQDLAAIEVRLATLAARHTMSLDPPGVTGSQAGVAGVPDSLALELDITRSMVRDQIRTLRHLITQMRPLALDTLGLAAALQDLAARAESTTGVTVSCDVAQLSRDIPPDAQLAIYRIVQEAVTNALKHAACHEIVITAVSEPDGLQVAVTDDGIGLEDPAGPPHGQGLGRAGMLERADAISGTLTWSSPPGGGTSVRLSVRFHDAGRVQAQAAGNP